MQSALPAPRGRGSSQPSQLPQRGVGGRVGARRTSQMRPDFLATTRRAALRGRAPRPSAHPTVHSSRRPWGGGLGDEAPVGRWCRRREWGGGGGGGLAGLPLLSVCPTAGSSSPPPVFAPLPRTQEGDTRIRSVVPSVKAHRLSTLLGTDASEPFARVPFPPDTYQSPWPSAFARCGPAAAPRRGRARVPLPRVLFSILAPYLWPVPFPWSHGC